MAWNDTNARIAPARHPAEIPLLILTALVSAVIWIALAVTIIGIAYAIFLAAFFFVSQLAFIAFVKGSAVKIGPHQFPELHARIARLSSSMGMREPEAYLMQAGGALNAFATRFLMRDMIVLFSDLLEACGDDEGAADMIIAHELGHLRCGHLKWAWVLLPGFFFPFLGGALSRAREYTCDRYGAAGAGSREAAVRGLVVLSAGARFAGSVNLEAFVRQREDLNRGWLTLGEWLGSHPPLSKRVAAIDERLDPRPFHPTRGRITAFAILAAFVLFWIVGAAAFVAFGTGFMEALEEAAQQSATSQITG